jgi:uncharacterized protein
MVRIRNIGGIVILLAASFIAGGTGCVTHRLGGAFTRAPEELDDGISSGARALLERAFEGIDPEQLADYHVHLLGLGSNGSGAYVNPEMRSLRHPIRRFKFGIYKSASGIESERAADSEYLARLVQVARNKPGSSRFHLLAFDRHYREDGTIDDGRTEFYVPNDYVIAVAAAYPDVFEPVGSVHPNRADALEEIERLAASGVRWIKWLPNSMGIDPADPRHDAYYDRMRDLDMVLLSHVGDEHAVEAGPHQELGNPLRLRRPLDRGLRVVVAHVASCGENEDLDNPGGARVASFDLFLRLMDEAQYEGLLFGEISGITQFNRAGTTLATLMARDDLHHRLVNGSDYPLPAVHALVRTRALVKAGFLTPEERTYLREIYHFNPLLFDFALKRTVRLPGTEQRLSAEIFMRHPALEPQSARVATVSSHIAPEMTSEVRASLQWAERLLASGALVEAADAFRALTERHPELGAAWYGRARTLAQAGLIEARDGAEIPRIVSYMQMAVALGLDRTVRVEFARPAGPVGVGHQDLGLADAVDSAVPLSSAPSSPTARLEDSQ